MNDGVDYVAAHDQALAAAAEMLGKRPECFVVGVYDEATDELQVSTFGPALTLAQMQFAMAQHSLELGGTTVAPKPD